jgi:hypothetical protein
MAITKRILITTESSEIFIVRLNGESVIRAFCADCATESAMLTLDEAVTFSNRSARELMRQTETGAVHSLETASGHLLVCQQSLQRFRQ